MKADNVSARGPQEEENPELVCESPRPVQCSGRFISARHSLPDAPFLVGRTADDS